ncbi:4Fe-4S dicluster domain-containing protein [Stenotrophomonas terrae]|uniref:4Fe-4S dicluster domain-containing protein n=1 Tax=Stenotrophomonas terrae TaxID=405446 RepID=UPI003208858E
MRPVRSIGEASAKSSRSRDSIRQLTTTAMLAAFYGLPWLQWNDTPWLLLDIDARQFQIAGFQMQPEQSLPLLWLALAALALLCLATSLYGRLWCTYACPQTVLTRLFRKLTGLTAFKGRMAALGPPLRQALWAGIALWTGISFVGYFTPIADLVQGLLSFSLSGWEWFWISFYGLATWANVVYLHEQVCSYLCPYSRIQTLITDTRTPAIQYNAPRGEPRGPRALDNASVLHRSRGLLDATTAADYVFRAAHPAIAGAMPKFSPVHLGDCTDCSACVAACPIGLDIRNGHSRSCIECGNCMDACDDAMAASHYPLDLIHRARPITDDAGAISGLRIKPLVFAGIALVCIVLAALTATSIAGAA